MTNQQEQRYSRHLILEGIGPAGQQRLMQSRVLVVGAGGLGSPVLQYLAASGVGCIGVVDGDVVSLSNLQRQTIHTTADLGRLKVLSAREKILALNPDVRVDCYDCFLTADNAGKIIESYDFVIDCTDNFVPKYLINDVCVSLQKPFCMGGINRFGGQLMTWQPGCACYRCIFGESPSAGNVDTCAEVGVLGSVAGICGTMQATECIKSLVGTGRLLTNRCLCFDALTMEWMVLDVQKNPKCALCGASTDGRRV